MRKLSAVLGITVVLSTVIVTPAHAATYYVCRGAGHSVGTYNYSTALYHRGHGDYCNPPIGIWGG